MNVFRTFLILFILMMSTHVFASPIEQCLSQISSKHHIIESEDLILSCFNKYKDSIGSNLCFQLANKSKKIKKSFSLTEKIKSICFYESSIFQNISSCLLKTKEFKNAESRDESVFDCYRQFQSSLTQQQCFTVVPYLTYPSKKEYMQQQCYNN